MSPDEFQQAWQAQSARTRVTIDADALPQEVQRAQNSFRAMIFARDVREAGTSMVMIPLWFFMGAVFSLPWSWYLVVPSLIWVSGFIVMDRKRHPQKPSAPDEPLIASVNESLRQVEHQIWLLRNVLWWYLLPFAIPILAFFAHTAWLTSRGNWILAFGFAGILSAFVIVLYGFIYHLNQLAVRTQLVPRRDELLALLANLRDEPAGEVRGEYPILMGAAHATCSRRRLLVASAIFVVFLSIGIAGILIASSLDQDYPKLSPFAAVRWQESQPEVRVGDEWFTLVSLDDLPAAEIVAFSQKTYGDKWRKRFEEDLVELLTSMGHPPGNTVTLVVQSLASGETRTLKDVAMTEANRRGIRNLSQARERREKLEATHNSVPIESADALIAGLIPRLREEKELVGLAAMVMLDGKVIASAVDGERKKGSGVQLAISDRWHLGSITKSITSTMIARLIEADRLQWSTTVGECYPDASIHDDWKAVTVRQLLTHTAGAPANFSFLTPRHNPARGAERTRAREEAVLKMLADKSEYPPGTKHAYSNAGYTIAGAMAEKATGTPWEDLVQREVFDPLELKGAGFGPPKSPDDTLDQPRGHSVIFGWKAGVSDEDDNTPIIGPAGIVHMTLNDLCVYATEHLRGELGEGKLLSAKSYELLHTPELDRYACGWVKDEPSAEIQHTVYWHNGSNTMWYALVAFIPDKKMVVAVTSNDGDIGNAEAAAWAIVRTSGHQIDVGAETPPD